MKKLTILLATLSVNVFALNNPTFINNKNCDQIITKSIYQICYNYDYKGATAVAYTIDGEKLSNAETHIKKRPPFYAENSIPVKYRSEPSDYTKSGYDRGHMANHADFDYSANILYLTYSMANIVPQDPELNRHVWIKAETYERLVARKLGTVNVINIIYYSQNPKRIGKNKIAVPQSFVKIIYNDKANFKKCFKYENVSGIENSALKDHEIICNI